MATDNPAVIAFGNLVNRASNLTFEVSSPTEVSSLLDEIDHAIRAVFGNDSAYLNELGQVKLYRNHAKKSNREKYFLNEKALLQGLLNKIITELTISDHVTQQSQQEAMLHYPMFGKPLPDNGNWSDVFVLMPFADDLTRVYNNHILRVAERLGLSCKRGDDFFSDKSIIDEVLSAIYHAKFCIAECTRKNPNVYYELGIAHTLGRPCILLAQDIEEIPFDLRHKRHITYEHTREGVVELEDRLEKTIEAVLQEIS